MGAVTQPRCGGVGVGLDRLSMKPLFALPTVLALSGCLAAANPPSLMPRAIETRSEAAEPPPATPVTKPVEAAIVRKIAALLAEATTADAEFAKADAAGAAAIRAGRGAAVGSEAWVNAEQSRSALVTTRQHLASTLSEIDSLVIAQADAASINPTVGGLDELRAAQSVIEAMVTRATARLDDLNR